MIDVVQALRAKLKERGQPDLKPASAKDLKDANVARFPEELVDFYRHWEPAKGCVELKQRIWSIKNAIVENADAVPGCALAPHGFIVFASTMCGDSYCIDTNVRGSDGHHPVVLFSHEVIEEDMPRADIMPYRKEVASSLKDFLSQFTNETLSEKPSYG
jgi:hypothetical protein